MKKKVGIITMHKVLNSGSALQAWALFLKIEALGYDCRIIDYQYPNSYHSAQKYLVRNSISERFQLLFLRLKYLFLYRSKKQKERFKSFWKENWKKTKCYSTREMILNDPPIFDVYITGSDQVWNPKYTQGDSVFMCGFIKGKKKISYASSFSQSTIPDELKNHYRNYLKEYFAIGVRESSGAKLVNELTGKKAEVVCDPTLLLEKRDYIRLAEKSQISISEPYLLAYILNYAYNPFPKIQEVINKIAREKKLKVIYLHANSVDNYHLGCSITSAGPCEFLNLFLKSSFIVTSSFHGTAFALNFEKPFYSIVPSNSDMDNRIVSLLNLVNASERSVTIEEDLSKWKDKELDYSVITPLLKKYRNNSISFLEKVLSEEYEL